MNQRIQAIAGAATKLFLQQGYAKTQISHIAKAVGVSVGTIYLDFTGKREIMHFILKCTVNPEFANQEFERPITDELFVGLEEEIIEVFQKSGKDFEKYLESGIGEYSFEMLISDAFDILSRYAAGCLFIEKNQFDFKKLAGYYKTYRKRFLDAMLRYIEAFIEQGTVRPMENPELSTMLIVEILSWWAMDIRYTSFETQNISPDMAKKVCMDNIVSAYKK